jgi:hypothetical protein
MNVTILDRLAWCIGFDWDAGNTGKNKLTHGVSDAECEQVFLNRPLVASPDTEHSRTEVRFHALGQTSEGRRLMVVFTIRGRLVRIVSARDMSRKERRVYEANERQE